MKNLAPMQGFHITPMKHIRVGVVGLGNRGTWAVQRVSAIPGVEVTAIADECEECVSGMMKWFADNGGTAPRHTFTGKDAHRGLINCGDIDVIYIVTSWQNHVRVALEAMRSGLHTLIEVPSAFTVDDCWELVETSEKTQRFCMQLENCCYGEIELLALNLCRKGLLGELVYGEAGYVHDLRSNFDWDLPESVHKAAVGDSTMNSFWRLQWNMKHKGNQYPTHGLLPICQYMNINHGDRLEYLVSMETNQFNFESYARRKYGEDSAKAAVKVEMGDMNTTIIKTALGKTILLQHDVSSPRPYTRLNTISGTKGILTDYPYRVTFESELGDGLTHNYFDNDKAEAVRKEHMHPMWKHAGPVAETVGGHGGADFIMDLRWAYCLQNGLPLDGDVYDLATTCSICELTEKSVRSGSMPQQIPDFTRGSWRTAAPFGIYDIDISKMPFTEAQLEALRKSAMEV